MIDAAAALLGLAMRRREHHDAPVVVGIAGAVASGKSTLADTIGRVAADAGTCVHIVSTDGFLLPNAVLAGRGLLMRKGFPESYDVDALRDFVHAVHAGATEVLVPLYSHETYDVGVAEAVSFSADAVVVIEGVNTLGALHAQLDLAVYLHAAEPDLERWYVERFHQLCAEARTDERSFYRQFADLPADEIDALARHTWQQVNLVNLREHIAPTRRFADCVVNKGPDHAIVSVEVRDDGASLEDEEGD